MVVVSSSPSPSQCLDTQSLDLSGFIATSIKTPQLPFPKEVKAILSDLDGTLIFCDRGHVSRFARELLECFGVTLEQHDHKQRTFAYLEDIYDFVNTDRSKRELKALDPDYFRYQFYASLEQLRTDMCQVLPGITQALNELESMGIQLALCTARTHSPKLYNQLSENGLSGLLDSIVTRQDHYNCGSVKDHIFRTGSSQLWTDPSMCIAIGDSKDDMESARRIGMYSIGVLTGLATKEELIAAGACAVIDSFADLPAFIRRYLDYDR